jgi:hypothetical protein
MAWRRASHLMHPMPLLWPWTKNRPHDDVVERER